MKRALTLAQMRRLDDLPPETKVIGWRNYKGPVVRSPTGQVAVVNKQGVLVRMHSSRTSG